MDLYLILLISGGVIILILLYLYLVTLQEKNNLRLSYAVLSSSYEHEIRSSKEKLEIMQNAKEELSKEFKLLANQIFEDKSKKFNHTHKEQFEMLLRPFREQITNFSTQSREQFSYEAKERHLLKDELVRLKEMNAQLSQEALNLTNALKGENKTQGNWGEIVLERILEESGLREGMEYKTQATLKSGDGKIYRPDVIIHMPQDRDIIIDSKVSLVAYERFMSQENPDAKALALKEHISSIAGHIKDLSSKEYERLEGVNTLDFVLLFMPIEGAFLLALEADGEFFKRAYDSNILVVSPSTLLVTLRTIEHIWRTQRQEEHAKKIANEAEAMYDKLVLFVKKYIKSVLICKKLKMLMTLL
ncbi:DNA recombination protein RmuC [Sulfurimonas gotlandica GD1]|uniref:DNA recombination protein RmuC n=1 Tax=Sulfurimonas gotlandica (strain DSM 19862 / JCM 16533 / GD1) TaxID=929558 RepID=B6BID3_SULGG|nr:DNA recombination protein RmuC [Sulfurimonas gotlandica]EDZ62809.1 DNA recombination protein RmuC [Sulfurimonas gotlandica GD1]EHP30286.1 DNA recombination protein RmuC [Sulfurimonas gotlandica GD1]